MCQALGTRLGSYETCSCGLCTTLCIDSSTHFTTSHSSHRTENFCLTVLPKAQGRKNKNQHWCNIPIDMDQFSLFLPNISVSLKQNIFRSGAFNTEVLQWKTFNHFYFTIFSWLMTGGQAIISFGQMAASEVVLGLVKGVDSWLVTFFAPSSWKSFQQ